MGVQTTSVGETASFSLAPVDSASSPLFIRFDADGDGLQERQRIIDLRPLNAGRGKTISLGQVTVGNNALVRGVVRRADVSTRSGHSGTAIIVPETPFFTYTSDDGSFVLDNLPEGPQVFATFREGYVSVGERLELAAGTVLELAPRGIERLIGPRVSTVQGRVLLPLGAPAIDVTVRHSGGGSTRTDVNGAFVFTDVPYGLYSVAFEKEGFVTAQLVRLVFAAPQVDLRDVTLAPGTSMPPVFEGPLPMYDGGVEGNPRFDGGVERQDAGSDGGDDAGPHTGVDGGERPVARISGPVSVVPGPTGTFNLNASNSSGTPVLQYLWTQTAGPTVTFPNLHPTALVNPLLTAPSMASILRFELTVRDGMGQDSLPASVLIPVGLPPIPRITPATLATAIGNQRIILSGAASTDPNSTGISSYEWTVNPSFISATPLNGGQQLQLDMPASVPTAVVVSVQLHVTNGVTIRSASPASLNFTLSTATAPQWYVDAGQFQGVAGGSIVTLRGGAFAPATASFTFRWSPEREPDSGVADFILTNPAAPQTTFVAPIVEGTTPRTIVFTLTATDTSGTLTPSVLTAQTRVQVDDQRPPQVRLTSITDGGFGPITWGFIEYDEPIGAGQVQVNPLLGSPLATYALIIISGKRVYAVFRPPLQPGLAYNLASVNIADLNGNMAAPFIASFTTAAAWTPAFESSGTSMAEPWPGLVVRPSGVPFKSEVFVFARRETNSWFFSPVDVFACGAPPCLLADDPSGPVVSLTGPGPRGHKGWQVNERPVALLQVRDFQGTPGALFERTGAGWASLPAAPNTIFSDGRTLSSVAFDAGVVTHVVLDAGSWATVSTIATNATEYPTDDASAAPYAYGSALYGSPPTVVLKSSRTTFHNGSTFNPSWSALVPLANAIDARVTSNPVNPYSLWLTPAGALTIRTGNANVNTAATGVSSFDAIPNPTMFMVALVINGQLELRSLGNGLTLPRVAGVPRNGVAGFSLNNDPACEAARPELAVSETWQIFVTWQERCGTGPWRVYVRALE
jgi:hypothetical protein